MSTYETTRRAFRTFAAGFPASHKLDDATAEVWADALGAIPDPAIEDAARRWVRNESRFPTLAGFRELARSIAGPDRIALKGGSCAICSDGWVELDADGPGTYTRCPNGCLPPPMATQRPDTARLSTATDWPAKLRATLARSASRLTEIGPEAFLAERGYDATKFEVRHSTVLRRVDALSVRKPSTVLGPKR